LSAFIGRQRENWLMCARKMLIKNPNSGGMKVEEPSFEPKPINGAKIVNLGPELKMTEALNSNN